MISRTVISLATIFDVASCVPPSQNNRTDQPATNVAESVPPEQLQLEASLIPIVSFVGHKLAVCIPV